MITEKKCKGPCGKLLPIDEYHWKSKRRGTRQARCKECMSTYGHSHYLANSQEYKDRANSRLKILRAENRNLVKSHIQSHPCAKCGESNTKVLRTVVTPIDINNLSTDALETKLNSVPVLCRNCEVSQD